MRKSILLIIIFLVLQWSNSSAQIDAVKISSGIKAFKNNEFQSALDALNEVSSSGRNNRIYFYYKGYTYYNLTQYDSSELYLKKYLLQDIQNEEVANTLGEIDYQRKKAEKAEAEKLNKLKLEEDARQNKIQAAETSAWEKAQYGNSVASYEKYLNSSSLKTHSKEAYELIETLKYSEDESAWTAAKNANSIESYEIYMNGSTIKSHLIDANEIHKNGLVYWGENSATKNDIPKMESYFDKYFRLYPNGSETTKIKSAMCETYRRNGNFYSATRTSESQNKAISYFNKAIEFCGSDPKLKLLIEKSERKVKRLERPSRFIYNYCYDNLSPIGFALGAINNQKFGLYISPRFNYNIFTNDTYYTVDNSGKVTGATYSDIRYANESKKANIELAFGLTKKVFYPLWAYAGVGIAYNTGFWKMDTYDEYGVYYYSDWVKNSDNTNFKPVIDAGLILNIKGFDIRMGFKSQDIEDLEVSYLSLGIGFAVVR